MGHPASKEIGSEEVLVLSGGDTPIILKIANYDAICCSLPKPGAPRIVSYTIREELAFNKTREPLPSKLS
jgi:hypothetical protein